MTEPKNNVTGSDPRTPEREDLIGGLCALGAFGTWGFLPIYFKYMHEVSAFEILSHRIVWSVILVGLFLIAVGRWKEVLAVIKNRRLVFWLCVSATLLSLNWLLFIWAVTHGQMLQGSLGYYINPLVNVVLGVLLLGERLTKAQWIAVALSVLGVIALAAGVGEFPWIAVSLGLLFGFYGYVRKTAPVGAAAGLFVETLVVIIPATAYLIYLGVKGQGAFGTVSFSYDLLLLFAGVVTAVPLFFFLRQRDVCDMQRLGFFSTLHRHFNSSLLLSFTKRCSRMHIKLPSH